MLEVGQGVTRAARRRGHVPGVARRRATRAARSRRWAERPVALWHAERDLAGADAVILPGGFSYGDYLRCGAIAARAPVMDAVRAFAGRGGPVLGICNGFQILCEAGLLPGALIRNASLRSSARTSGSAWRPPQTCVTRELTPGEIDPDPGQARRGPVGRDRGAARAGGGRRARGRSATAPRDGELGDDVQPERGDEPHRRRTERRRQRRGPDAAPRARRRPRRRPDRRAGAVRVAARGRAGREPPRDGTSRCTGRSACRTTSTSAIVATLGREPNRAELAMYSVMWSEHCSYKSSKIHLRTLPTEGSAVLVGPGQDAGAVDVGDGDAFVFKMESHSHPSAIEPYQGAATGVGGIVRDIVSMGARPAALLDPLMFGPLDDATEPVAVRRRGRRDRRLRELHRRADGRRRGPLRRGARANPCVNVMCVGSPRPDELVTAQSLTPHVGSFWCCSARRPAATGSAGCPCWRAPRSRTTRRPRGRACRSATRSWRSC